MKCFINDPSLKVVHKFIVNKENMDKIMKEKEKEKELDVGIRPDGKFPCRFHGCKKAFVHDGKHQWEHEKTHRMHQQEQSGKILQTKHVDDMLNYQHSMLEYGMLYRNFCDAIAEGDGARLVRCWKYFLLVLKQDKEHSRKYPWKVLICYVKFMLCFHPEMHIA